MWSYSRGVRTAIAIPLAIFGLLLLASRDLLPIGAALILAAWWVYERSGWPDSDALAYVVLTLGAAGAAAQFIIFIRQSL